MVKITIQMITIKINNQEIKSAENISVLKASLDAGIYIPHLCSHPDLDGYKCLLCSGGLAPSEEIYRGGLKTENKPSENEPGCKLCLIEINPVRDRSSQRDDRPAVEKNSDSARCPNKALLSNAKPNISNGVKGIDGLQRACATIIIPDMEILTDTERIRQARQENLAKIMAEHPHSCLTCAQSEGCSLTQCSSNVPQNERCCPKFNRCELQKVSQYIGIHLSTPRYIPQSIPIIEDEPLFKRNYNLCIGCLRCVRACRNLRGVDALGFVINPVRDRSSQRDDRSSVNSIDTSNNKKDKLNLSNESINISNGVNNGKIIVGSKKPTLKDSACKFCGACIEVCPTGAIMDKIIIGADRIKSLVPCRGACPIGMDIPDYIRLIKDNQIDKAFEVIRHKVPFPSVLGRVCFHPCEENCRRKEINEPISICGLKRYANEHRTQQSNFSAVGGSASGTGTPQRAFFRQPPTSNLKHSIAIIGAGPAGLTAAYYLAQKGYAVSVFEATNEVGGMMRYAIPEYRLPLAVLSNDLKK
ncbi:MAG: FAD-dependent oxidoreductase, partial [Planctomycetota bacterium]